VFVLSNSKEQLAKLRVSLARERSSLEDILRFPLSREAFEAYLKATHSQENLNFWLAVDTYEAKAAFIYQVRLH
jgi:hypothetical protein